MACNALACDGVRHVPSDMSRSFGSMGSDHTKPCKRFATTNGTMALLICMPGQILLPDLNDKSWKSLPWVFMLEYLLPSMNLLGLNVNRSSHVVGSLLMAHTFTTNCVLWFPSNSWWLKQWLALKDTCTFVLSDEKVGRNGKI